VMTEQEQKQYPHDVQKVTEFMLGAEQSVVKIARLEEYLGDGKTGIGVKHNLFPEQMQMVRNICKDVQSKETYDICVKALQNKPNGLTDAATSWMVDQLIGSTNQKTADALQKILLEGNISMKDAYELYYILHSGESSENKIGSFTLTLKILSLLKNNGYAALAGEWKSVISADLLSAALKGGTNIVETLRQYGLNDQQLEEMEDVVLTLEEKGLGYTQNFATETLRLWGEAPVYGTALAIALAGGTVALGSRVGPTAIDAPYMLRTLPLLKRFAYAEDLAPIAKRLNMPIEQVQKFQIKVKALFEDRKNFTINLPARLYRIRLAERFRSSMGKSLSDIAKALYTKPNTSRIGKAYQSTRSMLGLNYYTNIDDVARHLLQIAPDNEEAVADALKDIGQTDAEAKASIERVRGSASSPFQPDAIDEQSSSLINTKLHGVDTLTDVQLKANSLGLNLVNTSGKVKTDTELIEDAAAKGIDLKIKK
jgi:hypothetical protein